MNDPTLDPRILRTRDLLRKALMELIADKSFASLTIQEVTDHAGLHRTTFYLHYTGLHELLEDCARTLFSEMRSEIYKVWNMQQDPAALAPVVENVFYHLERHATFYRALLGKRGDPYFRELFQEFVSELIFEPLADNTSREEGSYPLEISLRFFSTGFTGIALWWLEKGTSIPAGQATQQIMRDILPAYLRLMRNGYR